MIQATDYQRTEAQQNNAPLVSVIIPAYNAAAWIATTLRSVLAQTYQNLEVLVVDDGSQDATPAIVRGFAADDARVMLLQQTNLGVAAARNFAIAQAKGDYIAPVDADDIWYPQYLEKQVRCLSQASPNVGLVYAWSLYVDEQDAIIWSYFNYDLLHKVSGNAYPALLYRNFIGNASATVIRRACFEQVGGYNPELKAQNAQGCEDWDLYLRIAERYLFAVVPEFLVGYRQITSSMSMNTTAMEKSYRLVMQATQQRCSETFDTMHRWSSSNFYIYLFGRSCMGGDVGSALSWWWQMVTADPVLLLWLGAYHQVLQCIARLVLRFIVSLAGQDEPIEWQLRRIRPLKTRTLAEVIVEAKQTQLYPWQFCTRLLFKRWTAVLNWKPSIASFQQTVIDPTFGAGQLHESHSSH